MVSVVPSAMSGFVGSVLGEKLLSIIISFVMLFPVVILKRSVLLTLRLSHLVAKISRLIALKLSRTPAQISNELPFGFVNRIFLNCLNVKVFVSFGELL